MSSSKLLTPAALAMAGQAAGPSLSRFRILLMATGAGLSVASLYYSQPMLGVLAGDIGASGQAAGLVPTLTQLGYALGILLLAPLGDRHDRRSIMLIKAGLLVLALLLAGLSPSLAVLLPASLLIGVSATLAQDIVPAAATLAPETQRGKVVGSVMTGLLTGILLSRVVSGVVAEQYGWRAMFFIAAATILLTGLAIRRFLPRFQPSTSLAYHALLGSLFTLWRKHGALRRAAIAQGLLSVGFSAFWSTLAIMLHNNPFHMGSAASGAFGLAGAAGALAAPLAGHMADRQGPEVVTRAGAGLATLAFVMLSLAPLCSVHVQLILLAAGAVLFDLGVQASLIAHQAVIYRIDPAARSRLNALLFVCMFIGMSLGSVLASLLLARYGWSAVTMFAALASLLALVVRCCTHSHP
ncbi:permease of the major facilitator superfamily [Aquitalea magnusonii]|uniref:Permease of the major facilitator superfamily n=1 Tax=Aquitalea magnusonii TaxID=332411 RepID=A0A3G9GD68_9NEIS|nr:MFS transporter [Aquitalea magnusonii]BBF85810.1 permease of the major facilitator superfamily [Aquitalea magnusonii]